LVLESFGFGLLPDATVLGIAARIWRLKTNTGLIRDKHLRLRCDLGTTNSLASASPWPDAEAVATYGSSSELWGAAWAWTPALVNAPAFGLRYQVTSASGNGTSAMPRIDYVELEVFYRPACPY
jgi:hypothetical protein